MLVLVQAHVAVEVPQNLRAIGDCNTQSACVVVWHMCIPHNLRTGSAHQASISALAAMRHHGESTRISFKRSQATQSSMTTTTQRGITQTNKHTQRRAITARTPIIILKTSSSDIHSYTLQLYMLPQQPHPQAHACSTTGIRACGCLQHQLHQQLSCIRLHCASSRASHSPERSNTDYYPSRHILPRSLVKLCSSMQHC